MRRVGGFFDRVASFEGLRAAAHRAARGKRGCAPVARFLAEIETNVLALSRELLDGAWRPGPFRTFLVAEPKLRRISAVPFRDRIVHHALMAEIAPVLDGTLSADSYACREGKGSHRAVRRAQEHARAARFVLQTDVEHFFETVDQEIVLGLVRRKVKDARALELLERIVCVPVAGSAPGKGLPIGSLTSQHLANFTLGALDRLAQERLGLRRYVRYMDDVLAFGDDKTVLHEAAATLRDFARDTLQLRLKESATRVGRTADGFAFLGFRVFPATVRLGHAAKRRFVRRLRSKERAGMGEETLAREAASLVAHVSAADTMAWRRSLFGAGGGAAGRRGPRTG